jgi:putative ABC transport system substrate-binding protein
MKTRRQILAALGAGALTIPLTPFAQPQGKIWRIGFLWETDQADDDSVRRFEAFKAGLRALGYAEGRSYIVEHRSARGELARLPALAAELLAAKVDLLVPSGTPPAIVARDATREIPILIVAVGDPIGSGLAASLAHPGGNITGLTTMGAELHTKRLDLLRQMLPGMRRVGFIYNPDNVTDALGLKRFESDCAKLGFSPIRAPLSNADGVAATFNALKREKAQGVVVANSGRNAAWRASIIEHAAKHRLPAIYNNSSFADSGGLISYGPNYADLHRRAAAYADKIFKGAKPGNLPIEQPMIFETIVNLNAAKALGFKFPDVVMLRADRVIP